jgi:hypothetical protein
MGANLAVLGGQAGRPDVFGLDQVGVEVDDGRDAGHHLVAHVGPDT